MSEEEMVKGCRHGDNEARKELYMQYGGLMLGLISRYISDKEEAKDVLHDGFIRAYSGFIKFNWRGKGSLRAWLSRLFVNMALNCLASSENKLQFENIDDEYDLVDDTTVPNENDVMNIPENVLIGFIQQLPAGYKTVFNLYAIDGFSHKEIAKLLNIKEKTSSSQFFKAKQLLVRKINAYLTKR